MRGLPGGRGGRKVVAVGRGVVVVGARGGGSLWVRRGLVGREVDCGGEVEAAVA